MKLSRLARGSETVIPSLQIGGQGYLAKVQHRVVPIGRTELARLMIQHEVGVRARRTFTLRSVDEDYFADPEG